MKKIKIDDVEYIPKEEYEKLKEEKSKEYTYAENRFIITEPCYCMGLVNVEEKDEKLFVFLGKETWEFPKSNVCILWQNISKEDVIDCHVNGEKWVRISTEFYKKAKATSRAFGFGSKMEIFAKGKDEPVLIKSDGELGFVLAPRIEQEDK